MKIIDCNILIPNKKLDIVKEKLRTLGNRYIEDDVKLCNISRHKLARAGNAAIALKACKLEPKFNENYDIVGFDCEYDKPLNFVLIFNEIAPAVEKYGYIVIINEDTNEKYIYVFNAGRLNTVQYTEAVMEKIKSAEQGFKPPVYCRECTLYKDGICKLCGNERDSDDFCSRGTKDREEI